MRRIRLLLIIGTLVIASSEATAQRFWNCSGDFTSGYMAHGAATGPEDQAYQINITYRAIYDAVSEGYHEVVKIQLVPLGKK
jgi:hypothetical protein